MLFGIDSPRENHSKQKDQIYVKLHYAIYDLEGKSNHVLKTGSLK